MNSNEVISREKNQVPLWLRIRRLLERFLVNVAYRIVRRISRERALRFGTWLGNLGFRLFGRYRLVGSECVEIAFGDRHTKEERLEIVRRCIVNLFRTMIDLIQFGTCTPDELLALAPEVIGREHLERAMERSEGGIIGLTGHIGSWEYCGVWVVASGWNLAAVGKEQRDPGVTKTMLKLREDTGITHIFRTKRGNVEIIRALKSKNWMLGLIADQNGGRDGVFVDFFGRPASSVRGPAFLALRYDVPVVPIFAIWVGDKYRIEILPEVEVSRSCDEERDVLENTQRFQKVLEGMVEKYPEQWLWMHRRWKTRPSGEAPLHRY